jgi:hypothetical protein
MDLVKRFPQIIDGPASSAELLRPLHNLATSLRESAHVGAGVAPAGDGRTHHLALWPLHRPAFRSTLVTVQIANGRGVVMATPAVWFKTAEELTVWLAKFMQRSEVDETLAYLRGAATEPVDDRFERKNGRATLAPVSPEDQEMLDRLSDCA